MVRNTMFAAVVAVLFLSVVATAGVATADGGGAGPPDELDAVVQAAGEPDDGGEEGEAGEDEAGEGEEEEGGAILGDWWGLGEEAAESPYVGLVELGVVVLAVGLGGYAVGKRTDLLPPQYRRYLLQSHEWSMLAGTALVVPHFFAVEAWEGLGFLAGVLLAVEVVSGFYGRHLHRHVVRLDRGDERDELLGRAIETSKSVLFARWRRIHVALTVLTAVVIVAHVLTAVGE